MEKEAVESIPEGKLEEGSEKDEPEPRTFIRVKRKITEDPAAQLILSYKKQRIASCSHVDKVTYETINSVLEFAGTHHPHEPAGKFVSDYVKLGATVSSNGEEETEVGRSRRAKMQQEARRKSAKGRYKMVSAKRGLDEEVPSPDSKQVDESNYLFHMFDLVEPDEHKSKPAEKNKDEDVITCNGVPMVQSKPAETSGETDEQKHDYVYDVYTLKSPLQHVEDLHVDVEHLWESELVNEAPDSDDDGPRDEADTDSNDENNPNNSYPEEDSDFTDADGKDDECYASFEQPEYDPDDDDGEGYFDAVQHQGSNIMKTLSKHLHQIKLETGGAGIKDSLNEFSSDEENVGSSEDENDF